MTEGTNGNGMRNASTIIGVILGLFGMIGGMAAIVRPMQSQIDRT